MEIIHYGIGKDYLEHWGLTQALREIFQNYIDYGMHTIKVRKIGTKKNYKDLNKVEVVIRNDYIPDGLEFLRIGYSGKRGNTNTLGKYGEGLKMALLIFARMGLFIHVYSKGEVFVPTFLDNGGMGESFAIKRYTTENKGQEFTIKFRCDSEIYNTFVKGIITDEDVLFKNSYNGRIVNRTKGDIYSGGMFVCNLKGISRAYDIYPQNMHLDRDRSLPKAFDVNYHASKLNEAYGKWSFEDQHQDDTSYLDEIPTRLHRAVQVMHGKGDSGSILVHKDDNGNINPITNERLISAAKKIPRVAEQIEARKKATVRLRVKPHLYCKTVVGALTKFHNEHLNEGDAMVDIKDIIARIKNGKLIVNAKKPRKVNKRKAKPDHVRKYVHDDRNPDDDLPF